MSDAGLLHEAGDNRLPVLAEKIRMAHCGVLDAAKTAAERAIAASLALLEAKKLVLHGGWGRWLQDNCQLPERTAQLYIQIAKTGLDSATVADLGLKAAAKTDWAFHDQNYDPFCNCSAAGIRDWHLYGLFLVREFRGHTCLVACHVEYILQKQFITPEEWLGPVGADFRGGCSPNPVPTIEAWSAFRERNSARTVIDITAEFDEIARTEPAFNHPRRRKRKGGCR